MSFEDSAKKLIHESQKKVKPNPQFSDLTTTKAAFAKTAIPKVPAIKIKKK